MTGERSHYPLRALLSPSGECSGPGWAEVWDRPLRLSTSTLPSSSTLLQILMTWVTKADHGSARKQQGLICYYSAYSRLWSPSRSWWHLRTDIGQGTQNLTTQSVISLDSMPKGIFFSFASVWLIQTSHCASRARLVLWHLHHTWRLKGKGTINYSRLSRWLCKGKKKNEKQWEGANLSLLGSKACTVLFFSFLCWLFCCEE